MIVRGPADVPRRDACSLLTQHHECLACCVMVTGLCCTTGLGMETVVPGPALVTPAPTMSVSDLLHSRHISATQQQATNAQVGRICRWHSDFVATTTAVLPQCSNTGCKAGCASQTVGGRSLARSALQGLRLTCTC